MRYQPSPLLLGVAGALVLLFAGALVWARELAVTDPALARFGHELLPAGAEVVHESGNRYKASNGWDRWYHPEDTAVEIVYEMKGVAQSERIALIESVARQQGWSIDRRTDTALDLSRQGYHAIVRDLRDDQRPLCEEQARKLASEEGSCGGRLTVFAE